MAGIRPDRPPVRFRTAAREAAQARSRSTRPSPSREARERLRTILSFRKEGEFLALQRMMDTRPRPTERAIPTRTATGILKSLMRFSHSPAGLMH